MTIVGEERKENVERALLTYIQTNYTTTAIWMEGENSFDTRSVSEYAEFSIIGELPRRFQRHVSAHNTRHGNIVSLLVQAVISLKPTATLTRLSAIRDAIVNVLRRAKIQIQDDVGGTSATLGHLFGEGLIRSMDAGMENDIRKHSLLFPIYYL